MIERLTPLKMAVQLSAQGATRAKPKNNWKDRVPAPLLCDEVKPTKMRSDCFLAKLSTKQKNQLYTWLHHRSYEECKRLVREHFGLSVSNAALHFAFTKHLVRFRQEDPSSAIGHQVYLVIETTSPEKLRVRLIK